MVPDHPAHAADVLDRVGADLASQAMQVNFDGVALDLVAPAVDLLLELRAREDRAGSREQRGEQRELARRQRDRLTAQEHFPRRRAQF
jgi:hypothetical protein